MSEEASVNQAPMIRIGDRAPDFHARSTRGAIDFATYRGRWVVLFAHPGDFTPVCTSEFVALALASARFAEIGCDLVAISVDSLYSHLAWTSAIEEIFGVAVDFPIVEDPSMVIGQAYGMIDQMAHDAATLRSTYFIDPDGIIRAITSYPATVGRSVEEILRIVQALQRVDAEEEEHIVTPEGWHPGDDVLLAPPQTQQELIAGDRQRDWFYRIRADKPARKGKARQ